MKIRIEYTANIHKDTWDWYVKECDGDRQIAREWIKELERECPSSSDFYMKETIKERCRSI